MWPKIVEFQSYITLLVDIETYRNSGHPAVFTMATKKGPPVRQAMKTVEQGEVPSVFSSVGCEPQFWHGDPGARVSGLGFLACKTELSVELL